MVRYGLPKFRSIHHLLVLLFIAWLATFVYNERIVPNFKARQCNWSSEDSTKILLIADPQLIDGHTYPGRNSLLLSLSQHTVDVYLKRNYKALLKNLKPDKIIFLGDYLDNARSSNEDYFLSQLNRFNDIFRKQKSYPKDKDWFVNVPGNHDIGFGDKVDLPHRDRFIEYFGNPNSVYTINNVDFVSIDSLSYSSDIEEIFKDSVNFINSLPTKSNPRILLSHIPLYRSNDVSCGSLRENPNSFKPYLRGYQYQTTLDPRRTEELLSKVQPDVIFSGDDHDYCEVDHPTKEYTVKSISMAMGIKFPAVQLLSIKQGDSFNWETSICYTQTPYLNVVAYMFMTVISFFLILWWDIKQRSSRYNYSILPTSQNININMRLNHIGKESESYEITTLSSNSKKISNFLKHQDNDTTSTINNNYFNIPKYTHTSLANPSFTTRVGKYFHNSKFGDAMLGSLKHSKKFLKKWNIISFSKHCTYFGVIILSLYYFGFCWMR